MSTITLEHFKSFWGEVKEKNSWKNLMFVGIVYALIFSLASANENIPSPLAFDVVSSLDKRRTLVFVSALRRGVTPVVSRLTGWLRPPCLFVLTSSKKDELHRKQLMLLYNLNYPLDISYTPSTAL
jgi:hypothetical protein